MKNSKLPSFMVILILTAITIVFWLSFNVYRVFTTKPSPVVEEEIMKPLSPKLDTDTINEIEIRTYP